MTKVYTPDRWVVLEFNSPEHGKIRKAFAGWFGGFTAGDSWKLNSGITEITQDSDFVYFTGQTGSVYQCYKNAHGMGPYMGGVLTTWQNCAAKINATIKVVDYEDSFTE